MPQLPLEICGIDPWIDPNPNGPNSNSYLYNAMIHPLIGLSIKGALWYQGNLKILTQQEEMSHSGSYGILSVHPGHWNFVVNFYTNSIL